MQLANNGSAIRMLARFAPPVAVMGAIFFFSSRTGDELGSIMPFFQRLFPGMESFDWGHFAAYAALAVAWVWAVGTKRPTLVHMTAAVLLCLLYGLSDEYHQIFVEGRTADWRDLRNDGIGAAAAMVLIRIPLLARGYEKLPHSIKHGR